MLSLTRLGTSFISKNTLFQTSKINRLLFSTSFVYQEDNPLKVFDRNAKLLQRARAAALPNNDVYDYLKEEAGYRLADRLSYIKRDFKNGLEFGCSKGFVARNLVDTTFEHWYMSDLSPGMLEVASPPENIKCTKKVFDEESPLPFEKESLDVILSNLSLHWVNDLPGCLKEVYRVLKKDGPFLATMFGGDTLYELRSALILAELEREGGFSSHISPFTKAQDIASLLNNAGFRLLTIDTEETVVSYPSMFELMGDLKGMAENNATLHRKSHLHRDTMMAAAAIYQEMFGHGEGIPATFQIINMIGWKPDPNVSVSQSAPGAGQISMKELHRLEELIKESGIEGRLEFMKEQDGKKRDPKE